MKGFPSFRATWIKKQGGESSNGVLAMKGQISSRPYVGRESMKPMPFCKLITFKAASGLVDEKKNQLGG